MKNLFGLEGRDLYAQPIEPPPVQPRQGGIDVRAWFGHTPPLPPAGVDMWSREARDFLALFDFASLLHTDRRTWWPRPTGTMPDMKTEELRHHISLTNEERKLDHESAITRALRGIADMLLRRIHECYISGVQYWQGYPQGFGKPCDICVRVYYVPILLLDSPIFEAIRRENHTMMDKALKTHASQLDQPFAQQVAINQDECPRPAETPLIYAIRMHEPIMQSKLLKAGAAITWTEHEFNALDIFARKRISREWTRRARLTSLSLLHVGKRRRAERDIFGMMAREAWALRRRYHVEKKPRKPRKE
jgi:hypothetical protein